MPPGGGGGGGGGGGTGMVYGIWCRLAVCLKVDVWFDARRA